MKHAPYPQSLREKNAPRADHVTVTPCECGACGHVLIWLRREDGSAIAVASLPGGSAATVAFEIARLDGAAGSA